jgi:hypothetical protein
VPFEAGSSEEIHGQGGFDASLDCKLANDAAEGTMKMILGRIWIFIMCIGYNIRTLKIENTV